MHPAPTAEARIALLVIGVSRSGTSALTRVLNLLGAALPDELLGPGKGNERGHWEPLHLLRLNEEILGLHMQDWWDPTPIEADWFAGPEAAAYVQRLATAITEDYGSAAMIAIKDPRLCRLAPLYFPALDRLALSPRVILPLRHPAEVVRSIVARDGTDPQIAELLWIRDLLLAEAGTRGRKRVWTEFSGLLADWRGTLAGMARTLELDWPIAPEAVADAIAQSLEPSLRHFDTAAAGTTAAAEAPAGPLALALWRSAQHGVAGDEAALRAGFDAVAPVVRELDRLGAPRVRLARTRLKALQDELKAAQNEAAAHAAGAAKAAAEAAEAAAGAAAAVAECERLRAALARPWRTAARISWRAVFPPRPAGPPDSPPP